MKPPFTFVKTAAWSVALTLAWAPFVSIAHAAPSAPRLVALSLDGGCAVTSGDAIRCFGDVPFRAAIDAAERPFSIDGAPRGIVDLVLGDEIGCVRTSNGAVACFGPPMLDEMENEIRARDRACEALPDPQSERCFDAATRWSDAIPQTAHPFATNAIDVAAWGDTVCVAETTGDVWCRRIGAREPARDAPTGDAVLGLLPSFGRAVAVSLGAEHACAVETGGGVFCWGDLDRTSLEASTEGRSHARVRGIGDAVDVQIGELATCVLRRSGAVTCFPHTHDRAAEPDSLTRGANGVTNARSLVVRGRVACVLTTDRRSLCWGENANGELGLGDTTDRALATAVPAFASATAIATGDGHTCGIVGRTLACAGNAASGFFGPLPAMPNRFEPMRDESGNEIFGMSVEAESHRSCVRLRDGTWACTADNGRAAIGLIPALGGRADVARYLWLPSCTLASNGTLDCGHRGSQAGVDLLRTGNSTICARRDARELWCAFGSARVTARPQFTRVARETLPIDFVAYADGVCTLSSLGRVQCTRPSGAEDTPAAFAGGAFLELASTDGAAPCARARSGAIVCAATRPAGSLPRLAPNAPPITDVEVTHAGFCVLDETHRLTCGVPGRTASLANVARFAMASSHAVALERDGRVQVWGIVPGEYVTGPTRRVRATPVAISLGR